MVPMPRAVHPTSASCRLGFGLNAICVQLSGLVSFFKPVAQTKPASLEEPLVKRTLVCAIGCACLALTVVPASAVESNYTASSASSADTVWAKIGDFCGIATWHPAVEKCALSADGKTRTLSLKGGGTIVENLVKRDDAARYYTYSIVESPLPVANYLSTIGVSAAGAGSKIVWTGKYDAKGASESDAKKVIDGIYQAGADVLAK